MALSFALSSSRRRITWKEEDDFWEGARDALNALIARCNAARGRNIQPVNIVSLRQKCLPLSREDYNNNITSIQDRCNALIAASEPYGPNPANALTLYKNSKDNPLTSGHRDRNVLTIQVFLNSMKDLYDWAGI